MTPTPAIIYHPADDTALRSLALDHCARRRYTVHAITTSWATVREVLCLGLAHVLVVATRRHLDPRRLPRTEIADEWPPEPRRPRRLGPGPAH